MVEAVTMCVERYRRSSSKPYLTEYDDGSRAYYRYVRAVGISVRVVMASVVTEGPRLSSNHRGSTEASTSIVAYRPDYEHRTVSAKKIIYNFVLRIIYI